MTFKATEDVQLIKSVVTIPQIYRALRDERPMLEWEPVFAPGLVGYVSIMDKDEFLGLVIVKAHNHIQWVAINLMLPKVGWKRRVRAAHEFFAWVSSCGCRRLISKVSVSNRYAIKFNEIVGMVPFALNPDCFLEDGQMQSEVWFGLSLPGVL